MKLSNLNREELVKLVKVAIYLALSSVITYLVTLTTENPSFFEGFTPIINLILVAIKNILDAENE